MPAGTRSRAESGFMKMQPALGDSSGCVRLRKASDSRATDRRTPARRRAVTRNADPQHDFTGPLQPAVVVAELHAIGRDLKNGAIAPGQADALDRVSDVLLAPVRVAEHSAADGAGRSGPRFEARRIRD